MSLPPLQTVADADELTLRQQEVLAVRCGTHEPQVRGSGVGRGSSAEEEILADLPEPSVGGDEDRTEVLVPELDSR